jgi:hypothetical protein
VAELIGKDAKCGKQKTQKSLKKEKKANLLVKTEANSIMKRGRNKNIRMVCATCSGMRNRASQNQ